MSEKKLGTVRKLLAKAERAGTPEEAESYRAKATELMMRYSIDEALLAADHQTGDRISSRRIVIRSYAKPKAIMLTGIGEAFGCKTIRLMGESTYGTTICVVYGWESDLEMIEVLFASLEIQAVREARLAHKSQPWVHGMSFTTSFLIGFAVAVSDRLKLQRKAAVADHSGTGAELVLVDRSKAVDDRLRQKYPELRSSRGATTSSSAGFYSGQDAGRRADLGQGGMGSRKAVGR